jgi:signal peptidase I
MPFDFELILTLAVIISGLIYLADVLMFAKQRPADAKVPILIEYSRSFFPILLIVLILRSFLAEPFRIPSGSDKPTLLVGDFILVNKFDYGIRLPVLHTKIVAMGEPKIGDIAVFRYPLNPSVYYIKRIVGVPGDRISYINKTLYINGEEMPQTVVGVATDHNQSGEPRWPVQVRAEDLAGIQHKIYIRPDVLAQDFSLTVPPGHYFAMGDNRDDSNDSRYWGFVPEQNLVGKAVYIWFSWDGEQNTIRWSRMGTKIH